MGAHASQYSSNKSDPVYSYSDYALYNSDDNDDTEHEYDNKKTSMFVTNQYKAGCNLEKFANKLKQYRHPCVLHYISWSVNSSLGTIQMQSLYLICQF